MKASQELHEELLANGFKHDNEDPEFAYYLNLSEDDVPEDEQIVLLAGRSGINPGDFHLSLAGHGILSMAFKTVKEAVEWSNVVTGFDPSY